MPELTALILSDKKIMIQKNEARNIKVETTGKIYKGQIRYKRM